MQQAIVEEMLENCPPDIYIRPELGWFRTLQFHRVDEIYRRAEAAKVELKKRVASKFEPRPPR